MFSKDSNTQQFSKYLTKIGPQNCYHVLNLTCTNCKTTHANCQGDYTHTLTPLMNATRCGYCMNVDDLNCKYCIARRTSNIGILFHKDRRFCLECNNGSKIIPNCICQPCTISTEFLIYRLNNPCRRCTNGKKCKECTGHTFGEEPGYLSRGEDKTPFGNISNTQPYVGSNQNTPRVHNNIDHNVRRKRYNEHNRCFGLSKNQCQICDNTHRHHYGPESTTLKYFNNKKQVIDMINNNRWSYVHHRLSPELCDDGEVIFTNPSKLFEFASERLRGDYITATTAIKLDPKLLEYVLPDILKNDKVKQYIFSLGNPGIFAYLPKSFSY